MYKSERERMKAAKLFAEKWKERGQERGECQIFWMELLQNVYGVDDVDNFIKFENKVKIDNRTKYIDAIIEETHTLIEQKSKNIDLSKKRKQSNKKDMTPIEQAKQYNNNLPYSKRSRYILTCNFMEFDIYDMEKPNKDPEIVLLKDLGEEFARLDFLVDCTSQKEKKQLEVSKKAADLVSELYDELLQQYKDKESVQTQTSINMLCVRLVFCLYAEDAGIFPKKNQFREYLRSFRVENTRIALKELFQVLDTKEEERDPYLNETLTDFPYVNGKLFSDDGKMLIPNLNEKIISLLTDTEPLDFRWKDISPAVFGAAFESTLNPETRRKGGMHYTTVENIHKVIDPLFLDDLKEELNQIIELKTAKIRIRRLAEFQDKLATLRFLDPACGSGNFLTETYICLRRLENEALRVMIASKKDQVEGQIIFGTGGIEPIKVQIHQFYGIEINDFAVAVAKTALWIAESQMMKETENIVMQDLDFLPLKTYANIVEGNALRMDWNDVVPAGELNYIMGNPPFSGARMMEKRQKEDLQKIFYGWKNVGNMDYVCGWYKKAADFIKGTHCRCAFVSTNSITQGEQAADLWKPLYDMGIHIDFAYKTFCWNSESNSKAHVHCVIAAFSYATNNRNKRLYLSNGIAKLADNINAYLIDADNVFVASRNYPICNVPEIAIGNKPIDGGFYLFDKTEMKEFIKKEPKSINYFHPWYGAREFINQSPRYCLYLGDCDPSVLRKMPECMKIVEEVRNYRMQSSSAGTRKIAETPTKFHVSNFPKGNYIVIPQVSSERRKYIPIGYMDENVLCSDKVRIMPKGEIYHFGILESNIHMAWVCAICGRLKSDYSYTVKHVYNNFPWPSSTEKQKEKIEQTAQHILDARDLYPDCSLATLYDPLTMPPELLKAHKENDKAVMEAYGFSHKMTEDEIVGALFEMYKKLTENECGSM